MIINGRIEVITEGVDPRVLEYLSRPAKPLTFGEVNEADRKLLRALGYW